MAGGSKKRDRRAELDAAYRRALGLPPEAPLPKSLGSGESAGGARGGRGATGRGKGRRK